jgi:uncharacterized protein (DUF2141 family)
MIIAAYLAVFDSLNGEGAPTLQKNLVTLFFLAMAITGGLFAETLTIRVENAEPGSGHLMIGVFNNESSFPDDYYAGQRVMATDRVMIAVFAGLPKGAYAVSVYQDSNGNEQLDKNIFGIPREKYGFSNNASRPDYKKCVFDFDDNMTITVRLR